jgi:hypothetical protein
MARKLLLYLFVRPPPIFKIIPERSLESSGMYHRVVTLKLTDVSEVRTQFLHPVRL